MPVKLLPIVRSGYKRTCQDTSKATGPPTHFQQTITLTWMQQMNLMKTKQHIINPKFEFCIRLLNWEGLILQQKYHFWLHILHSRKGHLQTVFHIYAYLKKRCTSRLALDPSYPRIDMRTFHQAH